MIAAIDLVDLDRGPAGRALAALSSTSPRLAAVARRWERCVRLRSAAAPGLVQIGATIPLAPEEAEAFGAPVISASGNGLDIAGALASALGETADLLSQIERPGDVEPGAAAGPFGGWIDEAIGAAANVAIIVAQSADGSGAVAVPADLALRRLPGRRVIAPVGALSAGCAAGADWRAAATRAVLELVERDAAAMWWLGGARPAAFPPDHPAANAAARRLARLRRGAGHARVTRILDIDTGLGVPVVAAISTDPEGRGLACGLAARLDAAEAARAALGELAQMEMAAPLAALRAARLGEAGLAEVEREHLRRADFAAADCPLLIPDRPAHRSRPAALPDLAALIDRLATRGHGVALVDLTRADLAVPVARALCPTLQPFSRE